MPLPGAGDDDARAFDLDAAHAATASARAAARRRAIIFRPWRGRSVSVASGSTGMPGTTS